MDEQKVAETAKDKGLHQTQESSCLIFELGEHAYGLATENILEIAPFQPLSIIPGRQAHYMGYLNLRGELVPVVQPHIFDAADDEKPGKKARLAEASTADAAETLDLNCLVIVGVQKKSFALPVKRVLSVANVRSGEEQDVHWRPRSQDSALEIFYIDSRPMFLLKAELILNYLLKSQGEALAYG